ncbi:PilN domain-containing protein [Vibrio japonicus]|uniref:PilN domain-containing protein n=1 Tax=Vibrio japonicus TaxID=1824638 RepID=A0ABY5LFJ8_9VIBR|nr:PilN domain-containing protein [Vibrio japonicus]UUM30794.1 PilN domain-containing protein [Vibrio japonicus]
MLHSVNLLPWREELRERHKRRFLSMLILGVLIAVLIQWAIGLYLQEQKHTQQDRLEYLNSYIKQQDMEIAALKKVEQEHKALLTRLSVVEKLQEKRNKAADIMNVIPTLIPEGVYVDKIKMNGLHIQISGISDTTSRLATMLDNLESSPVIRNVEMHSIVHDKPRFGKKFQTFKVSFSFAPDAAAVNEEQQRG